MSWIMLNIPLSVLIVGFAAGLPLWAMLSSREENTHVLIDPAVLRPVHDREHELVGVGQGLGN
jgi:hypothetical protein